MGAKPETGESNEAAHPCALLIAAKGSRKHRMQECAGLRVFFEKEKAQCLAGVEVGFAGGVNFRRS